LRSCRLCSYSRISQQFYRTPKVHYRVHKSSPLSCLWTTALIKHGAILNFTESIRRLGTIRNLRLVGVGFEPWALFPGIEKLEKKMTFLRLQNLRADTFFAERYLRFIGLLSRMTCTRGMSIVMADATRGHLVYHRHDNDVGIWQGWLPLLMRKCFWEKHCRLLCGTSIKTALFWSHCFNFCFLLGHAVA
jgi:hypothetical protein